MSGPGLDVDVRDAGGIAQDGSDGRLVLLPLTSVPKRDSRHWRNPASGVLSFLTRFRVLVRRQAAERAVWPTLIIVDTPRFDLGQCEGAVHAVLD